MAQIKDLSSTSAKWARRAGSASQEYTEGIRSPRRDWKNATVGAEKNYEIGVQAGIARHAFSAGVTRAGTEKWQKRATELGGARFASGVQASEGAYNTGFAPFHGILSSLTLPPRGSKGSPENLQRVAAVATALRAKKVSR